MSGQHGPDDRGRPAARANTQMRRRVPHGEAVAVLRPAIVKTPGVAMLWNTMGTIVSDQGDFANALVFFQEALRLDPNFPKARHNLGNVKLLLGDAG